MRKFLEVIDFGGDDITCLFVNEGDEVWSGWVKFYLKVGIKKFGILILYLILYEKFFSFVTYERFNKTVFSIYLNYLFTFGIILKDFKGWRFFVDS